MWTWLLNLIVPPSAVAVDPEHPLFESAQDLAARMIQDAFDRHMFGKGFTPQ